MYPKERVERQRDRGAERLRLARKMFLRRENDFFLSE